MKTLNDLFESAQPDYVITFENQGIEFKVIVPAKGKNVWTITKDESNQMKDKKMQSKVQAAADKELKKFAADSGSNADIFKRKIFQKWGFDKLKARIQRHNK